jgi:hypoxanthine phosphoribosyltransferase
MDKLYFSYREIHMAVRALAEKIHASGYDPDVMVAIGTGGFIPARILKTYLGKPILTVGLVYYTEDHKPDESPKIIQWIDEVEKRLTGKKILLVDEVDDTRVTLGYCVRELLRHHPARIGVAVLHNKKKTKSGSLPDEVKLYIAGAEIEDKWICYPWDAHDIVEHERMAVARSQFSG